MEGLASTIFTVILTTIILEYALDIISSESSRHCLANYHARCNLMNAVSPTDLLNLKRLDKPMPEEMAEYFDG